LHELSNDYELGSIKILSNHNIFSQELDKNIKTKEKRAEFLLERDKIFTSYQVFIRKEKFVNKIDRQYNLLKNIVHKLKSTKGVTLKKLKPFIHDIDSYLIKYENTSIIRSTPNVTSNICSLCSKEMTIVTTLSEITCLSCGAVDSLCGTVFEDAQFYYQEGQRTKHGNYDPSKHCRFWIQRIQAKETTDIPESVINKVKQCIKTNNIKNKEDITCAAIRKYLSQTNNSLYNENTPLIRKMITGEAPYQLNDKELQLIHVYFDKVIKVYNEIKPTDKTNVPYHPYLIYKIIEHLLKKGNSNGIQSSPRRTNNILSCIHLQSRETLIEHDKTWKKICEHIQEIEYKPTDRNL
jgi:hypothetical protein